MIGLGLQINKNLRVGAQAPAGYSSNILRGVPVLRSAQWETVDKNGTVDKVPNEGYCLDLNGTTNYVDLGDEASLETDDFHFEIDVENNDTGNYRSIIACQANLNASYYSGWYLRKQNDETLRLGIYRSSSLFSSCDTVATLSTATKYRLKVTKIGTAVKIYIDGVEAGSATLPTSTIYYGGTKNSTYFGAYRVTDTAYSFWAGKMGNVRSYDGSGNLINSWHLDEHGSTTAYDCVAYKDGTLTGSTAAIHATDNRFQSYQNEVGYKVGVSPTLIPAALNADGTSKHVDINGAALDYDGRTKLNAKLVNNNVVTLTAAGSKIEFTDLTNYAYLSYEGSLGAAPTVSGNDVLLGTGWITKLTLTNSTTKVNSVYTFAEGDGVTVYDTGTNKNHGELVSYSHTQKDADTVTPHNFINGFDKWINDSTSAVLRVPFGSDGTSIKTSGDTVTGYTWASRNPYFKGYHNDAETKVMQYKTPEMTALDEGMGYWYGERIVDGEDLVNATEYIILSRGTLNFITYGAADNNRGTVFTSSGTPTLGTGDIVAATAWSDTAQEIGFSEIHGNVYDDNMFNKIFADVKQPYAKGNIFCYDTALTGTTFTGDLSKMYSVIAKTYSRLTPTTWLTPITRLR